jgi:hypothetical protein
MDIGGIGNGERGGSNDSSNDVIVVATGQAEQVSASDSEVATARLRPHKAKAKVN